MLQTQDQQSKLALGPYLIVTKIEEGSQAIIFLAKNQDKFYGVKVYKHGHVGRTCFQREIDILTCMNDHVIVQPLQIYPPVSPTFSHELHSATPPFLVMEYYRNGDLRHFMNSGSMPVGIRNHLIRKMARCLLATEMHGVVHRDIKPENFLVADNHDIKLIDFGQGIRANHEDLQLVGTRNYIAPQIYKSKAYSYKSDIFALGVICFELAFPSKPTFPFKEAKISDSNFLLLKQNMFDRFWAKFSTSMLHPEFKKFLQRILSPDPEMRPSARQILEQPFLKETASEDECRQYFEITRPASKIPMSFDCNTF